MDNNSEQPKPARQLQIGEWRLNLQASSLHSGDESRKLEPQPFEFLRFLIAHRGEIVSREQLLASVWNNRVVSDDAIRRVVKKLREALGDDAKSPRYIKTIPLKGYSLIAEVSEIPITPEQPPATPLTSKKGWAIIGALLLTAFAALWLWPSPTPRASQELGMHSEYLTHLSGSELVAHYNAPLDMLIFLSRNNNNAPWQIFSKDLKSQRVRRLVWDDTMYSLALLSPDGSQIAYASENQADYNAWLAEFDRQRGIVAPKPLPTPFSSQYLASWSADGQALYFTGFAGEDQPGAIHRLSLIDRQWQQLTFPNTRGFGDFHAVESPDGRYLAVLRNVIDRRYSLLVLDLETRDLVVNKPLPFYGNALVWQGNNHQLAISSFKGDFYYYSLADDTLVEQPGSKPGLNDVFYHCGERCFFMREHRMNYTDIKEIPNPFETDTGLATLHIGSDDAEFNPIYSPDGNSIYYTVKDDEVGRIVRLAEGRAAEVLYRFNPRHVVTFLSQNASASHLTGKLEDRIFVLDLTSGAVKFVTSALESVTYPTWSEQGDALLFARTEQGQSTLLRYDLASDQLQRLEMGLILRRELADGRHYVVDQQNRLYRELEDGNRRFIITLPDSRPIFWRIHREFLYFSHLEGQDVHLTRQPLAGGEPQTRLLSRNSYNLNIDVHPNGQTLLITQSLLADSNIVKVTWPPMAPGDNN